MTERAHALVTALLGPRPRLRWPGTPDPRVSVLAEIASLAEVSTVRHLLGLLCEGGAVGNAAGAAVEAILGAVPAARLGTVERSVRSASAWDRDASAWFALTPQSVGKTAPGGVLRGVFLSVASFHPSGYVRETAVRQMAAEPPGRDLPLLVLRLNDWVPEVRAAAEAVLRARLGESSTAAWARVLPLLLDLEHQQRNDASGLVRDVVAAFTAPDAEAALKGALTNADRAVRRAASTVALRAGGAAAALAARVGVDDPDLLVRLRVARAVRAGTTGDEAVEAGLSADPAAGVRREILMARIEREADGLDAVLQRALLDAHRSVRAVARFYLRKRLGDAAPVPADVYRRALAAVTSADRTDATVTPLEGLAETGEPADGARARAFLDDPRPSVREAAVRAVAALDPAVSAGAVVQALDDPSPRVARTAARLVAAGLPGVDAEAAFGPRLDSMLPHVRQSALDGVGALPTWRALPHLLRAARSGDETVASEAVTRVERWAAKAARVFTAPMPREALAVDDALATASLPAELAASVRAVVARHRQ